MPKHKQEYDLYAVIKDLAQKKEVPKEFPKHLPECEVVGEVIAGEVGPDIEYLHAVQEDMWKEFRARRKFKTNPKIITRLQNKIEKKQKLVKTFQQGKTTKSTKRILVSPRLLDALKDWRDGKSERPLVPNLPDYKAKKRKRIYAFIERATKG